MVNFCEYTHNLVLYTEFNTWEYRYITPRDDYLNQVNKVIDLIGYMFSKTDDNIYILVPRDQAMMAVAEIIDATLSYKVIEYNHFSMRGNIDKKKAVIRALADKLEPSRKKLHLISPKLEDCLFFALNNFNIRHNNIEHGAKEYRELIAEMEKPTLEEWYDEIYQLCLLAFLELDNEERKSKFENMKKEMFG